MRNYKIDLLRFVGLFMIILAHISPPSLLFQLRNFDVVLMVFISGASFKISYKRNKNGYWQYVWKRIKRLVFPVWIFLTFLFAVYHFILGEDISSYKILTSYTFISGIGFVWIIRVFLLVALAAPFLFLIDEKFKSNIYFFIFLVIVFTCYEILQFNTYSYFQTNSILKLLSSVIFYLIPFSIIYLLGIRVNSLTKKQINLLCLLFGLIFISLGFYFYKSEGYLVSTQAYKYPVSIYYLSYALMISFVLWSYGDVIWDRLGFQIKNFVLFVSKNSIWIYLWHIPFIHVIKSIELNFLIEYCMVIALSTSMVFIQVTFLEKIIISKLTDKQLIKNLRGLFTG